jgi:hypothetical protein
MQMWNFHDSIYEEHYFLAHDIIYSGKHLTLFQKCTASIFKIQKWTNDYYSGHTTHSCVAQVHKNQVRMINKLHGP